MILGMLRLRKIVFYIFAAVYIILCPLIVARMLGFVINPLSHHWEKTGLIYISTNPPEATVYIDGRMGHQKTPTVIRDLTPGNHFLRLELTGYNDWECTVPIIGKKATVLANILLIPQQWPIKRISKDTYQNIFSITDDLLLASNPLLKDIQIIRTTKEDSQHLLSRHSIYAQAQLMRLFHKPQSPFVLLDVLLNDKHKFLWIKVDENPPLIEDVSDLFPQLPIRIAWSKSDNNDFFAVAADSIYKINIKNKTIYPNAKLSNDLSVDLEQEESQFMINDYHDLILRKGTTIILYVQEEFSPATIINITQGRPHTNMYFEEKNGELFYLDKSGFLYVAQILPYKPILSIPIPDTLRINLPTKEAIQ